MFQRRVLQVLVKKEVVDGSDAVGGLKDVTSTGTCVLIEGALKKTPEGTKQVAASSPPDLLCDWTRPPACHSCSCR